MDTTLLDGDGGFLLVFHIFFLRLVRCLLVLLMRKEPIQHSEKTHNEARVAYLLIFGAVIGNAVISTAMNRIAFEERLT
jgi:hypothetical protein